MPILDAASPSSPLTGSKHCPLKNIIFFLPNLVSLKPIYIPLVIKHYSVGRYTLCHNFFLTHISASNVHQADPGEKLP